MELTPSPDSPLFASIIVRMCFYVDKNHIWHVANLGLNLYIHRLQDSPAFLYQKVANRGSELHLLYQPKSR